MKPRRAKAGAPTGKESDIMSVLDTLTEADVESLLETIDTLESCISPSLLVRHVIPPGQAERLGWVMLEMNQ